MNKHGCGSIIIIINSMTSVFNIDASLPYNHGLFESLIVKNKNKDGRGGDLLLVLDTFFNGSIRCTTQNSLSNCLVTDSPTPSHTSYGSETTIVEHLKTSQFRCSNRPSLSHTTAAWTLQTSLYPQLHTIIQTIWTETNSKNATDIGLAASLTRRSEDHAVPMLVGTDSTQKFPNPCHTPCQVKGWPPRCLRHCEFGGEKISAFGK
ncbi:hypothetical protein CSKR_100605 [Clonorchis sinensis]|uniref:Uncharacterized protein n=1 Tax=Clonorchis sinensis TaxID=79923 RepID=A0A3R7G8S1_CLOSI|nr:hypothetical protein CSKR_100605 [Clonorchis sinensis]